MIQSNPQPQSNVVRIVLTISLLVCVATIAVAYGTNSHNPADNSFADEDDWANDPETYIGEQVSAHGIVVSTDPYRIEANYGVDTTIRVTIEDVETDVKRGQEFGVFGTLTDERMIVAERTHHRYQWEAWYMYGISAVGVLWILTRFVQQWTVNKSKFAVVPQSDNSNEETNA